jgi:hypothetical protein
MFIGEPDQWSPQWVEGVVGSARGVPWGYGVHRPSVDVMHIY